MARPLVINRHAAIAILTAILIALTWCVSAAGTICGTVRDADTMQPVALAAVFLFDSLGQYTGIHAGTDVDGKYCLGSVAPGIYSIQVRRDNYETVVVRDIVVQDGSTGVDVAAPPRMVLRPPMPNPARDAVTFDFTAPIGSEVRLEIYDVRGRFVRGWRGPATGTGRLTWNFLDFKGNGVTSGVYMVRLIAGDVRATQRFVHLR